MANLVDIPRWKYWLSYVREVELESTSSSINPVLQVSLWKGKIQLCTANAVYSYQDRYDNFRLLFEEIKLGNQSHKTGLLLGLGLGSVPLLIEQSGLRLERMTLVEIDEQVIYLANKYILSTLSTPFITQLSDAKIFAEIHEEQYDLILSDVFLDDEIPDYFLSNGYLANLDGLLNPGGLLLMNTLASTKVDKIKSMAYFENVFRNKFPTATLYPVWENYMLHYMKPK